MFPNIANKVITWLIQEYTDYDEDLIKWMYEDLKSLERIAGEIVAPIYYIRGDQRRGSITAYVALKNEHNETRQTIKVKMTSHYPLIRQIMCLKKMYILGPHLLI